LDRPLADIRTFLKAVGIEKLQDYPEPEDCLAFELEVMRWLIEKQLAAADRQEQARIVGLQSDFLKQHLLVWGPACGRDIAQSKGANFYPSVAKVLQGFLALELNFFREWGLDQVESLDAARMRYGNFSTWRGPTFDASDASEKSRDTSSKNED
jgi:hypothetical protein